MLVLTLESPPSIFNGRQKVSLLSTHPHVRGPHTFCVCTYVQKLDFCLISFKEFSRLDLCFIQYILCTISLAIPYVSQLFVLIFVQCRSISIAMTRTGS